MTTRLYLEDPYLTSFSARIVDRREREKGMDVALDRTAFYPEGGGQPADRGTLGGVDVVDVQSDEAVVWHRLQAPLSADAVTGEIDWARRFDHMQQHHGQHLLSAAFEDLYELHTVSFHLGATVSSIDLDGSEVADSQLRAAEALANRVIWENRPIHARFVSDEELESIRLRKAPTVAGPIRVVSVPGFDHSACGGTHPSATGAVGIVHVRRRERRGAEIRVEFACGSRVLDDLRRKHGILGRMSSDMTVGLDELEDAVQRLRESEKVARKRLAEANDTLIDLEAESLLDEAEQMNEVPVVVAALRERDPSDAAALARAVAKRGAVAAVVVAGETTRVVLAAPENATIDCGPILQASVRQFGGRGGGRGGFARGAIPDSANMEAVLQEIRQGVQAALS